MFWIVPGRRLGAASTGQGDGRTGPAVGVLAVLALRPVNAPGGTIIAPFGAVTALQPGIMGAATGLMAAGLAASAATARSREVCNMALPSSSIAYHAR